MEGGELEEGGMGEKGGVDLDNAQANAGGARKKKDDQEDGAYEGDSEVERHGRRGKRKDSMRSVRSGRSDAEGDAEKDKDKDRADDGLAPYPVIVQKGKGEDEYETAVESQME